MSTDEIKTLVTAALEAVRHATPKYLAQHDIQVPADWPEMSKALTKLNHKSSAQGIDPEMELRSTLLVTLKALRNMHEHGGLQGRLLDWTAVTNASVFLHSIGQTEAAKSLQNRLLVLMPEMPPLGSSSPGAPERERVLRLLCGAQHGVYKEHQSEPSDQAAFAELIQSFGDRRQRAAELCTNVHVDSPRYERVLLTRASDTQVTWTEIATQGARRNLVRVAIRLRG